MHLWCFYVGGVAWLGGVESTPPLMEPLSCLKIQQILFDMTKQSWGQGSEVQS